MGYSHGSALILKNHEDFEKVATYVKRQVREKSLELLGEDLSVDNGIVGLQINDAENTIIWHDYGHHGEHLDFDPIAESVIKEFPGVDMELEQWWGPTGYNYMIVDGEWEEYTLWKFVAYTKDKGEEVLLDYKEISNGLTDEEKHDKRDKMCKELAEQHSRQHPGVEIAVYCYDYFDLTCHTNEFYRAKDGRACHEYVDDELVRLMEDGLVYQCDFSVGQVLLSPECAEEIIKRARNGQNR